MDITGKPHDSLLRWVGGALVAWLVLSHLCPAMADNGVPNLQPVEKSHLDELKGKAESVRQLQELAEVYFEDYTRLKTARLRQLTERADAKFHQMNFTMLTSILSYNEFRLSQNQISSLVETFREETQQVRVLSDELDKLAGLVAGMRAELAALASKSLELGERRMMDELSVEVESLGVKVKACQDDATAALDPADKVLESWDAPLASMEVLDAELNAAIIRPSDSPFFGGTRALLVPLLRHWVASLPDITLSKLPASLKTWGALVVGMCVTIPVLRFILLLLLVRIARWLPPISPFARRGLSKAFLALSAGIVLLVGSRLIEFPQSILIDALALLLLARWGLDFSWALNNYNREGEPGPSPISHLFWVYTAATIFQFLSMPSTIIAFAWPVTLVAAAILARPVRNDATTTAFRRIHGLSICLLLVFAALSLFGLSDLSMIITGAWFMLAVAIQFGIVFSAFFRRLVESRLAASTELVRSLVIGLGVPTIWTAMLASVVLWVGDQYFSIKKIIVLLSSVKSIHGCRFSLLDLSIAVFLFFAFKTCLDVVTAAFERKYGANGGTGVPALNGVLSYAIWAVYAGILLLLLGVDFSSLAIAAGGLGVGIGLGLQSVITNFVNGLSMLFSRTIREGDVILFDGQEATVLKIDLHNTMIRTSDNAITVVPNTDIIDKKLTNLTLNDPTMRRAIRVRIGSGANIDRARDLLMEAALGNPRILKEPPPVVLLVDFENDPLFELRVWLDIRSKESETLSELRFEISRALSRHGIQGPCTTVEVRSTQMAEAKP